MKWIIWVQYTNMIRPGVLICVALMAILQHASAQETSPHPEEAAIRRVVEEYQLAQRNGDAAGVKAVTIATAKGSSPGGIGFGQLGVSRTPESWQDRPTLLRRVAVLTPTVAVATGVWRKFDVAAPFDAGTFVYTLVRETAGWKIAYSHEAFLPGPTEHRIATLKPSAVGIAGADGWITLFDGRNLDAWVTSAVGSDIASSWRIDDGALVPLPAGIRSSLLSRGRYLFFDLEFEWLATRGSNSGVKYRLLAFDRLGGRSAEALGPEYQIADDDGDEGARVDTRQRSGALYAALPVETSAALPLGQWNRGRILVTPDHVEHWLNGKMTASYKTDVSFASPVYLQHHTTVVRFRNIRIRPLITRDSGF